MKGMVIYGVLCIGWTEKCGYYECKKCKNRFLSLDTMKRYVKDRRRTPWTF
ncbi:MAG: hypothetical protein K2M46_07105 [Lachnospiraceae bacterium]|nr:hypothetical protein [Lachnospiraceae bacterium]